jgi:hypothetical protein
MIHLIYLSAIAMLLYNVVRAYNLYNKKHKELIQFKESNKVPYDILAHYEKAYVKFYRWMIKNGIDKKIIDKFDKLFKCE